MIQGLSPPPGYVEKSERSSRLLRTGAILGGVAWASAVSMGLVLSAFSSGKSYMDVAVPVFGPLVVAGEDNTPNGWRAILILDSGLQIAGGILFGLGFARGTKRWIRCEAKDRDLRFTPLGLGRSAVGWGLTGRF